ncbi:MAG: nuclear transport factor 2 family protein [Armatimonadetes bacterium]|nr:nuclear transport factor 2 family protein [Armatimonadota bacterium]
MQKHIWISLLIVLCASVARAHTIQDQILELEDRFMKARQSGNWEELEKVLSKEVVVADEHGKILDLNDFREYVKARPLLTLKRSGSPQIRIVGGVVLVTAPHEFSVAQDGRTLTFKTATTRVWVLEPDGTWRLHRIQWSYPPAK